MVKRVRAHAAAAAARQEGIVLGRQPNQRRKLVHLRNRGGGGMDKKMRAEGAGRVGTERRIKRRVVQKVKRGGPSTGNTC